MNLPVLFISGAEIAFVVFILIMVFGADKIPEIARGLGKGMRGIQNATNDIKGEVFKSSSINNTSNLQKEVKDQIDIIKEEAEEIKNSVSKK